MKNLAPHVYLTRPDGNQEIYHLRVMVPVPDNYRITFPSQTSANGASVRQITAEVEDAPGQAATVAIKNYELVRETGGAPGVEVEEEVHVIVEQLDASSGNWNTTGVSKSHYDRADSRQLGALRPCVYLTRPNPGADHEVYTLIKSNDHAISNVAVAHNNGTCEVSVHVANAPGNGGPLSNQQFVSLGVDEDVVVSSVLQGVDKGSTDTHQDDADDKPNEF